MPSHQSAAVQVKTREHTRTRAVATQTFSACLRDGEWVAKIATTFEDGSTQEYECEYRETRRKALQDIERVLLAEAYPDPPDM
jgi:hypothetical protein